MIAASHSETDPGFAVFPDVLGRAEIDSLATALAPWPRSRAGARHLMRVEAVAQLARDVRLLHLASAALGASALPFRATLFEKSSRANWLVVWHQDTALPLREQRAAGGWGPWSRKDGILYAHAPAAALRHVVALRVHLDDSTALNGPLRVIPGSHELGVLSDEAVGSIVARARPHECLVGRGGVVVMRPLVVHSSSKSTAARPRRVLHLEYADSMALEGLKLAVA